MQTNQPNQTNKTMNNTTRTERPNLILTAEEKTAWVKMYTTERRLPSKYVPCTRTGKGVVMFGDNLHTRVIKYGGIENLLTTFVCREAQASANSVVKEQLAQIKAERKAHRLAKREEKIVTITTKNTTKTKTVKGSAEQPVLNKTNSKKKTKSEEAAVTA